MGWAYSHNEFGFWDDAGNPQLCEGDRHLDDKQKKALTALQPDGQKKTKKRQTSFNESHLGKKKRLDIIIARQAVSTSANGNNKKAQLL